LSVPTEKIATRCCVERDDYWQCAHVIRKDAFKEKYARGLKAFSHRPRPAIRSAAMASPD
jgi:hypothetical protein